MKRFLIRQSARALVFVDWATREHIVASRIVFFAVVGLLLLGAVLYFNWGGTCPDCDPNDFRGR